MDLIGNSVELNPSDIIGVSGGLKDGVLMESKVVVKDLGGIEVSGGGGGVTLIGHFEVVITAGV